MTMSLNNQSQSASTTATFKGGGGHHDDKALNLQLVTLQLLEALQATSGEIVDLL